MNEQVFRDRVFSQWVFLCGFFKCWEKYQDPLFMDSMSKEHQEAMDGAIQKGKDRVSSWEQN